MSSMRVWWAVLAAAVMSFNPGWAAEPAPEGGPASADVLAAKVQDYYEQVSGLRADFTQTYFRIATSKTLENKGRFWFKKPRRLRWSMLEPRRSEWVVRDDTMYWFKPEEQQMVVREGAQSAEAEQSLAFLTGDGKLSETFRIAQAEAGTHGLPKELAVLELTPKQGATYRKLYLGVRPESGQVEGTVLVRRDGNRNRYLFRNIQTDLNIDDQIFVLSVPDGTEVIRAQ